MPAVHALPPAIHAPAPPSPGKSGLEFHGARIGMTLAEWKGLPPPGPPGHPAGTSCTPQASAAKASGLVTCAYVGRYGRFVVPESFDLAGRFRARQPSYEFSDGRLVRIEFRTSIDAFDVVMARLKSRFGAPTRSAYDSVSFGRRRLPRALVSWRVPGGMVRLVDPSEDPSMLAVRLEGAGTEDARPAL